MDYRSTVAVSRHKGQTLPGLTFHTRQGDEQSENDMTQINTGRVMAAIIRPNRVNIYSPIVEAVSNALEAIEESKRRNGRVIITLHRDKQQKLVEESREVAPVVQVDVEDNGVGFTDENLASFDEVGTEHKVDRGGKGFGRLVFLHFFDDVQVESVYKEGRKKYRRAFKFVRAKQMVEGEKREELKEKDFDGTSTTVSLSGLKKKYSNHLNKNLDTISRKLLERLLSYFALEEYKCPEIIVRDAKSQESITLNDYLKEAEDISEIHNATFEVEGNSGAKEAFTLKLFKVYFTDSTSTINLVANSRLVTDESLGQYVAEFKDEFSDTAKTKDGKEAQKRFVVKAYIQGAYLDSNVSAERGGFEFGRDPNSFFNIGQNQIEKAAAEIIKKYFGEEVATRQKGKERGFESYVNEKAPWHKSYFDEVDLSEAAYGLNDAGREKFLQEHKIEREFSVRAEAEAVLKKGSGDPAKIVEEALALVEKVGKLGTSELAHYVATRKVILDLFKKSLEWDDKHKHQKERMVHEIIFPQGDSKTVRYEDQNLWLLDERLSFYEYVASDQPLSSEERKRPDIFGKPILVRENEDPGDAIVVFEFKKPQKKAYKEKDNPVAQIRGYVREIRAGKAQTKDGRPIQATENTPAYGFVVCDLSPKIREYCEDATLSESPDRTGYFGFHPKWRIYFEVMSYDQLLKRAEMRNRIFFKKLGL